MDPTHIGLFDLADQRLAWVAKREALLAQNVANADTPGWRARDLKPFAAALTQAAVAPALTSPMHLAGARAGGAENVAGGQANATRAERAPDGNAVAIDTELMKVAQTDTVHAMVTDLYKKYLGLFRIALGR